MHMFTYVHVYLLIYTSCEAWPVWAGPFFHVYVDIFGEAARFRDEPAMMSSRLETIKPVKIPANPEQVLRTQITKDFPHVRSGHDACGIHV